MIPPIAAADLKREGIGPGADSAVSLEAGEGIQRLFVGRKLSPEETKELAQITATIAKLKSGPITVTPIIFSLDERQSLNDLLAEGLTLRFDLAGDGKPEIWPWVKPNTGLLIWDPKQSGRVDSGGQLFGSVTWWTSWRHGYEPLSALDDNQDGWLLERELDGLSVWRDRNSNGLSEPGEVISVRRAGVRGLAVRAAAQNKIMMNPAGVELTNGRSLPTYDWTPTEVKSLASAK